MVRFSQATPTLRLWMPPTKVNKTHSTSSATPLYMVLLLNSPKRDHFYQDRLGTSIGKTQKRYPFPYIQLPLQTRPPTPPSAWEWTATCTGGETSFRCFLVLAKKHDQFAKTGSGQALEKLKNRRHFISANRDFVGDFSGHTVSKDCLFEPYIYMYIYTIILPRQARDKHRENSKKGPFFVSLRVMARGHSTSSRRPPKRGERWRGVEEEEAEGSRC
jgi:hypothetical protein